MQASWLWGFDQFISDITTTKGGGMKEPTISIKYVNERLYDMLSIDYTAQGHYELNENICYFLDELAENYKTETGEDIWGDDE